MSEASAPSPSPRRPSFAHASEAELARILTYYDVRWEYEPDTFPIGWTLDGEVVESFSPDFYLPELDLYLELTTLKQSLVRKKNRKLRRLRELYPDVRIKLFYARDFRMLLLKFGRLALADELSGATGQATPPRVGTALGETGSPKPAEIPAGAGARALAVGKALAARLDQGAEDVAAGGTATVAAEAAPGDAVHADQTNKSIPPLAAGAVAGPEAGRTPRGRRRGRRRRAAARAAAVAAGTAPHPGGVTGRGPGSVSSTGTLPA